MRVSEVYASTQGEGPNVGRTTVFTRFGGCNLRCPGWPCDTEFAIDPAFRKEWTQYSPSDVFNLVRETADISGAECVTLTGGEPFLQKHDELEELVTLLIEDGFHIDCFSNGTILYPDWAPRNIQFIMDWKLPGSGESSTNAARYENLAKLKNPNSTYPQCVKFVCKDENDLQNAYWLWMGVLKNTAIRTYYGKVWDGELTDAQLVEWVMKNKLPWYLNIQTHNYVWPRDERGR